MSAVRRNLALLMVSQAATWIVSFISFVVLPRLIDPSAFGAYGFATVYVQYFALFASLETATVLTRHIARHPDDLGGLVRNGLLLKVVTVSGLSAIAIVVALIADFDGRTDRLIVLACVGMAFTTLNGVFQGALAGLQRLARPAMWVVVQLYVGTLVGLLTLVLGGDIVTFAAANAAATAIPLVANGWALRDELRGPWTPQWRSWRMLVMTGLPLLTLMALTNFYGSIDVTLLQINFGEVAVGWYSLAMKWAGIPMFVCAAVVAAFFPVFSRHGRHPGPELAAAVNRALSIVVVVSTPAAFGLAAVAPDVIRTLAKPAYASAIPALQILALQIPIAAVDTVLGSAIIATDRARRYIWVPATAAVLTPASLAIAFRFVDDMKTATIVAALLTTLTEIGVFFGAWRLRAPGVLDRATASLWVRTVAAGVAIPVALHPIRDVVGVVPRIALGVVVFAIAAVLLRIVRPADLRHLSLGGMRALLRPEHGADEPTETAAASDP